MSQFINKLVVWSVVILLLFIGVFLQVRASRGAEVKPLTPLPSVTVAP